MYIPFLFFHRQKKPTKQTNILGMLALGFFNAELILKPEGN